MHAVKTLDPEPGPRLKFAMAGDGRWRIDGRHARLPAEIANDDDGTVIIRTLDPRTGEVLSEEKIAA